MPFVHRTLLLSVVLLVLMLQSIVVSNSVGHDQEKNYRKLDEELQLSNLLGFRYRHRVSGLISLNAYLLCYYEVSVKYKASNRATKLHYSIYNIFYIHRHH